MNRLLLLAAVFALTTGCSSSAPTTLDYERDELISVQHNTENMMTLLTYRDPLGQTRHVLRQNGVFEFALTYTLVGKIALKERGGEEREIDAAEASIVTSHINLLFRGNSNKLASSI